MTIMTAGSAVTSVIESLVNRTPNKDVLWDAEIDARRAFHLDPTTENLTAWADAREQLEEECEA